jgi:hypothetical protein
MLCDKCDTIINDKYNKVCYSCGHRYHRTCLLLKKYSLLNPSCSICDDGKIIRNRYIQYVFKGLEEAKGSLEKDSVASSNEVVEEDLVKDLEEDLVKDLEESLEVGKKDLFHSSKILCIIFCTIYVFNLI